MSRAARTEWLVVGLFGLTALTGVALLVVYILGGQTQVEGVLLGVASASLGIGIVLWAQELMVRRTSVEERHPLRIEPGGGRRGLRRRSTEEAGFTPPPAARSGCSRRLRRPRRGARDPGPVARAGARAELFSTSWRKGKRLVGFDGHAGARGRPPARTASLTVFPEGAVGSADSQTLLIRVAPEVLRLEPERGSLGAGRVRRLLEGLHPRRLPGRACTGRANGSSSARATSRRSTCSTGATPIFGPAGPAAAAAADRAGGRRHVHGPRRLPRAGRAALLEHHVGG